MIWESFGQFLAMGGYALYVWGACGMVAAALGAEVLLVERRLRLARRRVTLASAGHGARRRYLGEGVHTVAGAACEPDGDLRGEVN